MPCWWPHTDACGRVPAILALCMLAVLSCTHFAALQLAGALAIWCFCRRRFMPMVDKVLKEQMVSEG